MWRQSISLLRMASLPSFISAIILIGAVPTSFVGCFSTLHENVSRCYLDTIRGGTPDLELSIGDGELLRDEHCGTGFALMEQAICIDGKFEPENPACVGVCSLNAVKNAATWIYKYVRSGAVLNNDVCEEGYEIVPKSQCVEGVFQPPRPACVITKHRRDIGGNMVNDDPDVEVRNGSCRVKSLRRARSNEIVVANGQYMAPSHCKDSHTLNKPVLCRNGKFIGRPKCIFGCSLENVSNAKGFRIKKDGKMTNRNCLPGFSVQSKNIRCDYSGFTSDPSCIADCSTEGIPHAAKSVKNGRRFTNKNCQKNFKKNRSDIFCQNSTFTAEPACVPRRK